MTFSTLRNFVCRTALLSLVLPGAPASDEPGGRGAKLLEGTAPNPAPRRAPIRVDVNMTLVPVTVVDPRGRNVRGLERDNFLLFDEKQPRDIVSFGRQDAPVSVGIVFDSSRSMTEKLAASRAAVRELLKQLNPEDEAFVVGVADRPQMVVSMDSDPAGIANALLFTRAAGTTPLIDGVVMGLQCMSKARNPRHALVVVSDGGDNNSRYTYTELLARAGEADTQIFTIGLVENPKTAEEEAGPELLTRLAGLTGGRALFVQDAASLRDAMARIAISLHNQYVLGYYPPVGAPAGKYRKIQVKLKIPSGLPRLQIYARRGYYTPGR